MRLAGSWPSRGGTKEEEDAVEVRGGGEGGSVEGLQGRVAGLGRGAEVCRGGSAAGGIFLWEGRGKGEMGPPPNTLLSLLHPPQFRWGGVRWDPPKSLLPAMSPPPIQVGEGVKWDPPQFPAPIPATPILPG